MTKRDALRRAMSKFSSSYRSSSERVSVELQVRASALRRSKRRGRGCAPWCEKSPGEAVDDLGPDRLVRRASDFCIKSSRQSRAAKSHRERREKEGRTRFELVQARGDVAHGLEEVDGRRPPERLCRAEPCWRRAGMLEA